MAATAGVVNRAAPSPSVAGVYSYNDYVNFLQQQQQVSPKATVKVKKQEDKKTSPPPFIMFEGYAIAPEDEAPDIPEEDYENSVLRTQQQIQTATLGSNRNLGSRDSEDGSDEIRPPSAANVATANYANPDVPDTDYDLPSPSVQAARSILSGPAVLLNTPEPKAKKTLQWASASDEDLKRRDELRKAGSIPTEIVSEKEIYGSTGAPPSQQSQRTLAPDGGFGWVIVGAAFTCLFTVLGNQYSFGLLYVQIQKDAAFGNVSGVWSSLVGSLALGMYLFVGAPVGRFIEIYGCRIVTQIAAFVISLSLLASSYTTSVQQLWITYGILTGCGFGMAYGPALIMIGQYFTKRRALATSVAVSGSGVGTLVFSFIARTLQTAWGWRGFLRYFLVPVSFVLIFTAGSLYVPLQKSLRRKSSIARGGPSLKLTKFFDFPFLRSNPYVRYLCAAVAISATGYFVPSILTVKYATDSNITNDHILYLVPLFGAGSVIGRLVFGKLAQGPVMKRLFLYGFSIVVAGSLTIALGAITWSLGNGSDNEIPRFIVFCLYQFFYGMFAGAYIALLPVVTADLCGIQNLTRALGLAYTSQAFFVIVGPPILSYMKDSFNGYHIPYIVTGSLLISSILPLLAVPNIFRDAEKLIDQPKTRTNRAGVVIKKGQANS
eukprot:TRINITY_DN17805_c0_g2_i1.p1 TRINITY_DN17805_c0_g2~~TRINITY_DN17805_c0_g2_i1.p1  ORF type:complete len:661 (-),score=148.74 TRINITY_DN17805_c0_g2_i1:930-2912(-)